jgi:hypothetical protein
LHERPEAQPEISTSDKCLFPNWSRRWDGAIFEITPNSSLKADSAFKAAHDDPAVLSSKPPEFGAPVYNIGAAECGPMKISLGGHVLRHKINLKEPGPFYHEIDTFATFSADLDQFNGMSHQLKLYTVN